MLPNYTRTVEPASEPFTASEAKEFLRVDGSTEDTTITLLLKVAREEIERQTGRALLTQTWKAEFSAWPACRVLVLAAAAPLASVTSVKYWDENNIQQTLSPSIYSAKARKDRFGYIELSAEEDWPEVYDRSDAIEVVFVAGVASTALIPAMLRYAIQLQTLKDYGRGEEDKISERLDSIITQHRISGFIA